MESPLIIVHDNSWSHIRTRIESMHDSLSTPPSPKSTFSDDQTTNPESADHYFVPDLQATLMNSNQGNSPLLFIQSLRRGCHNCTNVGRLWLEATLDFRLHTDVIFQKLKSQTTDQSLFRATKNSSNRNRLVSYVRRSLSAVDQGTSGQMPIVHMYLYFTLGNFLKVSQSTIENSISKFF